MELLYRHLVFSLFLVPVLAVLLDDCVVFLLHFGHIFSVV